MEEAADLSYFVRRGSHFPSWTLVREGQAAIDADDAAELLFHLEKDLAIAVQRRRAELLFLHAAALEWRGTAYLLAGESGQGKSTTAWGLLHHGFRYLSDELSPVSVDDLEVYAYPQALCLKRPPPAAYPLPADGVVDLGRTLHIPVAVLPHGTAQLPCRLGGLLFVAHDLGALSPPRVQALTRAEAAARAYVVTLNALAHPSRGIDSVVRLTDRVPSWVLHTTDLAATCRAVVELLSRIKNPH